MRGSSLRGGLYTRIGWDPQPRQSTWQAISVQSKPRTSSTSITLTVPCLCSLVLHPSPQPVQLPVMLTVVWEARACNSLRPESMLGWSQGEPQGTIRCTGQSIFSLSWSRLNRSVDMSVYRAVFCEKNTSTLRAHPVSLSSPNPPKANLLSLGTTTT